MLHALRATADWCEDYLTVVLSVFLTKAWHRYSGATAKINFAYPTSILTNLS